MSGSLRRLPLVVDGSHSNDLIVWFEKFQGKTVFIRCVSIYQNPSFTKEKELSFILYMQ